MTKTLLASSLAIGLLGCAIDQPEYGSTEGMSRSEETSPYYRAWVECSDILVNEVRDGILV